jgi:beta-glucosidase
MPWGRFGWSEGYHQRFGVVHVDFDTRQLPPKASFGWYRDLIAARRRSPRAPPRE